MKRLKVINLYAGPGAGKSTTAAGLFYKMKRLGYKVELITEFAKEVVYEENFKCLEDQIYVFAKQNRRIKRLEGHVDYVITDSPLLLTLLYSEDEALHTLARNVYNSYDNYNFFIERTKPYIKLGRTQNEEEAKELDRKLDFILYNEDIVIHYVRGDETCVDRIFDIIEIEEND